MRDNNWLDKSRTYAPINVECDLDSIILYPDQQVVYRINHSGFIIDLFVYARSDANQLIVSGQDALVRKVVKLPYFYRWSWHLDTSASFITFNDPTLYLRDNLGGGWCQGYKKKWALEALAEVIARFQQLLLVPNDQLLLYGISAGGFWALMSGPFFPDCRVIVEIPQTDLFTYEDGGEKAMMMARVYKGKSVNYIRDKYPHRLRVIDHWKRFSAFPKTIWYYQNLKDPKHTRTQLEPFWDEYAALKEEAILPMPQDIRFCIFNRKTPKGGHIPMDKEDTIATWNQAFL